MANFDGTDSHFDSRDVIERIGELEAEFTDATDSDPAEVMSEDDWAYGLGADGAAEIAALIALRDEAEGDIADWQYGEAFYTEDEFVNYAKESTIDCMDLPADLPEWITDNIDWEGVAGALRVDYKEFEFRGTTYLAR